jgi:hypothetical protein
MWAILMATVLAQVVAEAQQAATNQLAMTTNAPAVRESPIVSLTDSTATTMRLEPADTNSLDYTVSKTKIHLTGPLVPPLKAKSASDFSRRLLNLFNPFSSEEPSLPSTVSTATVPVSNRAWSTIVGWNPGGSAFPTEAHHEPPQLRLISVGVEKQP